jgi:hypothetical protein
MSFTNEYGIDLDGIDDYVSFGSDPSLLDIWDGGGTLSFWVYLRAGGSNVDRLFDKDDWFIYLNSPGVSDSSIRFLVDFSGTDYRVTSSVNLMYEQWVHVQIEYNSDSASNQALIYINGVDSTTGHTTPVGTRLSDTGNNLVLGARYLATNHTDAIFDEISIWSKTGITGLYNSGVPTDISDHADYSTYCISWWRCGDGDTYPTITDQKGSNDGTMTNMTSGDIVTHSLGPVPLSLSPDTVSFPYVINNAEIANDSAQDITIDGVSMAIEQLHQVTMVIEQSDFVTMVIE